MFVSSTFHYFHGHIMEIRIEDMWSNKAHKYNFRWPEFGLLPHIKCSNHNFLHDRYIISTKSPLLVRIQQTRGLNFL